MSNIVRTRSEIKSIKLLNINIHFIKYNSKIKYLNWFKFNSNSFYMIQLVSRVNYLKMFIFNHNYSIRPIFAEFIGLDRFWENGSSSTRFQWIRQENASNWMRFQLWLND